MLAILGTIPDPDMPILVGLPERVGNRMIVDGHGFSVNRGTAALLAAAAETCHVLGHPPPMAYLVGDIGRGDGSRRLYRHLVETMAEVTADTLVFHYLQPDVDWHNRVLFAIEEKTPRPRLIADAGFMYAAKMSGQAEAYDLFTPDIGELAFLADEQAPHPFYTRGFIFHMEHQVPEMISRAYQFHNASQCLLVKGARDTVADRRGIQAVVEEPNVCALEAIGGTGDTLTGVAATLLDSGMPVVDACRAAARINRRAGEWTRPTPATQIHEMIPHLGRAVYEVLGG